MCDASGDNDDVYIDAITWRGSSSAIVAAPALAVVEEGEGEEGARVEAEDGEFALSQNRPNPFDGTTTITFQLPAESHVTLEVFDVTGRKVASLLDETRMPGEHAVRLDAQSWTPGIYFYRLTAGGAVEQKKMLLLE